MMVLRDQLRMEVAQQYAGDMEEMQIVMGALGPRS
jgi:hypothetical protein